MRSRLCATAYATCVILGLTVVAPAALAAQEHSLRVWWVPQAEPLGLQSWNSHSDAMVGGSLLLLYRRAESSWSYGVSLGGMSQASVGSISSAVADGSSTSSSTAYHHRKSR